MSRDLIGIIISALGYRKAQKNQISEIISILKNGSGDFIRTIGGKYSYYRQMHVENHNIFCRVSATNTIFQNWRKIPTPIEYIDSEIKNL